MQFPVFFLTLKKAVEMAALSTSISTRPQGLLSFQYGGVLFQKFCYHDNVTLRPLFLSLLVFHNCS